MRMAIVAFVTLALSACGAKADGPPHIEVDRTPCAHCGMLISEPVFAAAYRAPGSEARVFDDIGCLLAAASRGQWDEAEALRAPCSSDPIACGRPWRAG